MGVDAQTIETYDNTVIREDLEQQYTMISPEETPFQTAIGVGPKATATYHEWTVVELANPSTSNRVIEGEDTPAEDDGTLGKRFGNYTQISDKVVSVSNTSVIMRPTTCSEPRNASWHSLANRMRPSGAVAVIMIGSVSITCARRSDESRNSRSLCSSSSASVLARAASSN